MRSLFLIGLMCFSFISKGQRIKDLELYLSGSGVTIKFTLSAGTSCNGYKVLRSLDSLFYNEIYNYSGICGLSGADEHFSANDASPALNQYNFYKIQLPTFETSDTKKIFVTNTRNANVVVFPNPVTNDTDPVTVKFLTTENVTVEGHVYDEFGKAQYGVAMTATGNLATMNVSSLRNGLYLVWLTDGTERYSAKFIVMR